MFSLDQIFANINYFRKYRTLTEQEVLISKRNSKIYKKVNLPKLFIIIYYEYFTPIYKKLLHKHGVHSDFREKEGKIY